MRVVFTILLGVLWLLGLFSYCYAFQIFLPYHLIFSWGADTVLCLDRGWILMHVRTIVWVGGSGAFELCGCVVRLRLIWFGDVGIC